MLGAHFVVGVREHVRRHVRDVDQHMVCHCQADELPPVLREALDVHVHARAEVALQGADFMMLRRLAEAIVELVH
jgi:hypothetical protein